MNLICAYARPKTFLPAIFVFVLALNACSTPNESDEETASDGIPKICNLVETTTVTEILGTDNYTVTNLEGLTEGAEGCKFIAADQSAATDNGATPADSARTFNFIRREGENTSQTKTAYMSAVTIWQNSNLENRQYAYIDNLGDGAFYAYSLKTPQLVTYKNDVLLVITFGNLGEDKETVLTKARTLAEDLYTK